jgi:hypothetical protein
VTAYLTHSGKWSGVSSEFIAHLRETGRLRPEDEPPDVGPWAWVVGAFFDLCTQRAVGMSLGPLPVLDIAAYGNWQRIEEPWFVRVIGAMDIVYLSQQQRSKGNG